MPDSYTVFSKQNFSCPWCQRAAQLLTDHDIKVNSVSLEPDQLDQILERAGMTTIPVIYHNGTTLIGGYDQLVSHLNTQGYFDYE